MKTHTNAFKTAIKEYGRELDSIITYTINEQVIELGQEELNSITPSFQGNILKSVMKQLILDSNVEIPIGTELTFEFGVKVRDDETVEDYRDNYDYINFGHYIVKEIEKREDTESYEIKCYDKMLYSMIEYDEKLDIEYPITIREYIDIIADKLGLTFKNKNDTFTNYDKEINEELFMSKIEDTEEGSTEPTITYSSLGYTYRDILDQLAQVTASTICINEDDDELEIRYINDTEDSINEEYLKDTNVNFGEMFGPVNSIVLSRSAESDNLPKQDEESINENGIYEITISDNLFMNFEDRDEYLEEIYDQLHGLTYIINNYNSTGICYYNLCDKYSVIRDNTTYECIMFNDEIQITQGLEENIYTDSPDNSTTEYEKTDKAEQNYNKTMLIVNKQENRITGLVQTVENQEGNLNSLTNTVETNITSTQASINAIQRKLDEGVETLKNQLITIDAENGITVSTEQDVINTKMNNYEFSINNGDTKLAYFGYDTETNETKAEMNNLKIKEYFDVGYHRIKKFEIDGEEHTGVFYIGE